MNSTNFSTALLCVGLASLGVLAGCAEGEPIASDFRAVGSKGGQGGQVDSLAAGGSSVESAGSDVSSSGGAAGAGGSDSTTTTDSGMATTGDSGTAGGGAPYDGPPSTGLLVETLSSETKTVQFQVRITNNGMDAPPISALKIRYYLVADSISDASTVVFDYSAWNGKAAPYNLPITAASKATFAKVTPAKPMADSYIEIGVDPGGPGDQTLGNNDMVQYQVRLTAQGEDPTNDYSYKSSASFTANDHMVVIQGGNPVAGMAP